MPPKQLTRLKTLLRGLSERDKSSFRLVTEAYNRQWKKKSKILKLFDVLDSNESGNPIKLKDSERKLLELLEDKLLDHLLTDTSLAAVQKSSRDGSLLLIHKKFLKAKVLHQKGVMERACNFIKSCSDQAYKLEEYELSLQCLRMQLSFIALHQCHDEFYELLAYIDELEHLNFHKNQSIRMYKELRLKKHLSLNDNLDLYIEHCSVKLSKICQQATSKTILYVKMYFEKELMELKGDLGTALHVLTQLYRVYDELRGNPLILNHYEILSEQGRLSFEMGNHEAARFFLTKSLNQLPVESDAYQQALEALIVLEIIEGKYSEVSKLLESFVSSTYFKNGLPYHLKHKWWYFLTCSLFSSGKFRECQQVIDRLYVLKKPANDFNLHLRTLKILCCIEREKLDMADRELESLRKFIARNELQALSDELGLSSVVYLLNKLKQQGYQHNEIESDYESALQSLRDRTTGQALIHQLPPYENWLLKNITLHEKQPPQHRAHRIHAYRRELLQQHGRMERLRITG